MTSRRPHPARDAGFRAAIHRDARAARRLSLIGQVRQLTHQHACREIEQRQEEQREADIEDRVAHGDRAFRRERQGGHPALHKRQSQQAEHHARGTEGDVADENAPRRARFTPAQTQRNEPRAKVRPEQEGHAKATAGSARADKAHDQQHHRHGGMQQPCEPRANDDRQHASFARRDITSTRVGSVRRDEEACTIIPSERIISARPITTRPTCRTVAFEESMKAPTPPISSTGTKALRSKLSA